MDNDNTSPSNSNFFSGFLLGLLVGAAVVFLLGTKKGKKLLKAISEDGTDNIAKLLDKAEQAEDLDEVVEEKKEIAPKKEIRFKEAIERPRVRRFFRGISRRVN